MSAENRKLLDKIGDVGRGLKNAISRKQKKNTGDELTGVGGITGEASKGMAEQKKRQEAQNKQDNFEQNMNDYADQFAGYNKVVQKKGDEMAKTAAGATRAVSLIADENDKEDLVNTANSLSNNLPSKQIKEGKKEPESTTSENNNNGGGSGNGSSSNSTEDHKPTINDNGDPESDAKRIMEMNGLNVDKYTKEDGSIDYKKLQRSKIGFSILNALLGGLAGGAAGAAFKDIPDLSKGLVAQEIAKRQEVVDTQKSREEDKYVTKRDLERYAQQMGISTTQAKQLQAYGFQLNRENVQKMRDIVKNYGWDEALKIGINSGLMNQGVGGIPFIGNLSPFK